MDLRSRPALRRFRREMALGAAVIADLERHDIVVYYGDRLFLSYLCLVNSMKWLHGAMLLTPAVFLCTTPPSLQAQSPAPGPQAPDDAIPIIFSASGGISRGAYQAGVNWALVQIIRRSHDREFVSEKRLAGPYKVALGTGASAGNVNAAFSAIEYCAAPSGDTPESSLFWKMWANVGWDQLVGPSINDRATESSLLTRRYIDSTVFAAVKQRMDQGGAVRGCEIPIGITLTRVRPGSVSIGTGENRVHAATQRFATLFTVQEYGGRLAFMAPHPRIRNRRELGKVIIGPADPESGEIPAGWVSRAMQASGAFPLAFQPMRLSGFRDADDLDDSGRCRRASGAACEDSAVFIDGGLFDNNPLTLALDMYAAAGERSRNTGRTQVIYIDTDRVRGDADIVNVRSQVPEPDLDRGLRVLLRTASGTLPSARQYELQALARRLATDPVRSDWIRVTTRSQPMMGNYLGGFAAFLGRPFREYDFYEGIYDGLHYAAHKMTTCTDDVCRRNILRELIADPEMPYGTLAPHALHDAFRAEYDEEVGGVLPAPLPDSTGRMAARLELLQVMLGARAELVRAAKAGDLKARSCTGQPWEAKLLCSGGLDLVLGYVRTHGNGVLAKWRARGVCDWDNWPNSPDDCPAEETFAEFVENPPVFVREAGQRLVHQIWRTEDVMGWNDARPGENTASLESLSEIVDLAYNAILTPTPIERGLDDPSSIQGFSSHWSADILRYMPYRIGMLADGGGEIGYRGTYNFSSRFAGVLPLSATYRGDQGRFEIIPGIGGLSRVGWGPITSVETSVQWIQSLNTRAGEVAVGTTLNLFADRINVTGRYALDRDRRIQRGNALAVAVGINDVNGMLYWWGRTRR